jgi:hypothetical protein
LTTENTSATTEPQDESGVIKGLRQQLKDKDARISELENSIPDTETLEAEIRERLKRDSAIEAELGRLGHPVGILGVVKDKLGENEVNTQSVAEALQGIGYEVDVEGAAQGQADQASPEHADLARVTQLSNQVSSATQGDPSASVVDRINSAQSAAEIEKIMSEIGGLKSHV